jgi:two-component system, chemotaxis family, chemotaxis protein CheY
LISGASGLINRTAIQRAHDDADSSKVSAMSDDASAKDVIVADNDYIIRGILRSVLEGEGFTVLQTIDGFEAIDYAMRTRACLVVLDYKMPRLDGISACAEIRRLPDYAATPIIILTAFDDEETRAAARQAGVTAVLAKPFKPVDLLRVISDLLGASPAARGEAGPEPVTLVWKRRQEPPPLFGEPVELSQGRRVLNICRR